MIRSHLFRIIFLVLSSIFIMAQAPQLAPVKIDSDTIVGLGVRNIGPAIMSGSISALDAVYEKDRLTVFCGAASGGLWRSKNGGTTWNPVFDKHNQSIGAIRIVPANPQIIWLGTGESWVRNSVSIGDGIYRSNDGGDTWTNLGLSVSERIAAIEVDPRNPDVVYVAVQGPLWSSGGDRGVYKTNDGGKTWTKLNGDPKRGLPEGILGRIAVAIAPFLLNIYSGTSD